MNLKTRTAKKPQTGFTLIEVMIVVIIIGILATLVVPKLIGRQDQALVTKARHDISTLENALKLYRLDNFQYPSSDQGLTALVEKPAGTPEPKNWKKGGYIERMPKDPWGNDYLYLNPGNHGEIDIYSLGADGQEGGEEMNADIGNWDIK